MTISEKRYANMIAFSPCPGIPQRGIEKGHMYANPEGEWGTLDDLRDKYGKDKISQNYEGPLCPDCEFLLSNESGIKLLK